MPEKLPDWRTPNHDVLRRFACIRVVASDVDGTLEDRSESVYRNISKQLWGLRRGQSSIDFMIATGRTLTGLSRVSQCLGIGEGIPSIVYNGSLVVDSKTWECHNHKKIPLDFLESLIKHVELSKVTVLAYFFIDDREHFSLSMCRPTEIVVGWTSGGRSETEFNGMPVQWVDGKVGEITIEPTAILLQTRAHSFDADLVDFISREDRVSITTSGSSYLELRPADSNKGRALECACNLLGFERSETVALGDNDNDVEMLQWAGIGIAVANASPKAIEAADYVCNHGVARGVVEVLRLISHSRRYFLKSTNLT